MTLEDMLIAKNLNEIKIQNKINEKIEEKIKMMENVKTGVYNIYKRVSNDPIYQIKKTKEFLLDNEGNLYIIYPYGNNDFTSEYDLIVSVGT